MGLNRNKEELEKAARESFSIAAMCRYFDLKPCGGNYRTMHTAIEKFNIDTSHFRGQGWNIGLGFKPFEQKPLSEILVKDSTYQSHKLKQRLIKERIKPPLCERCGLNKWLGQTIPLELHHINGDNKDNRLENLQLLCSNCHAQTDNYRGRNVK